MSLMKRLAICGISITLPLAAASQADARHGHHYGHHYGHRYGHQHGHHAAAYTATVPIVRRTVYRVIRPTCAEAYLVPLSSHILPQHRHAASYGVAGAPVGGVYSSGYRGTALGGTGAAWGGGPNWATGPRVGVGTSPWTGRGWGVSPSVGYGSSIGLGRAGMGMW